MARSGAFSFVLHSHLPYARLAGRWPHGEEWLHEAAAETYIPLLDVLSGLVEDGIHAHLTITLSPVLLEQLADEIIQQNFRNYLQERIAAIQNDVDRFKQSGQLEFAALAVGYLEAYRHVQHAFDERYGGDLVSAFRKFQEIGMLEIATCAATHGFLPLLGRDESIELQLKTAIESYKRHFGRTPTSIWLPECAYRPSISGQDGADRVGLESFLGKYALGLFFAETQMVEQGRTLDAPRPDQPSPFLDRILQLIKSWLGTSKRSTFQAYCVGQSNVAVLARNRKVSLQVWSADWGYPGEVAYREFHKKDGHSGMRYWRITGSGMDLGDKKTYNPRLAAEKVQEHADSFYQLVLDELVHYKKATDQHGIIAANFDTELFGHWWFEGLAWLDRVLRKFAVSDEIELTTASAYLEKHPPELSLNLPEGSWGEGGKFSVWDNEKTNWMWSIIHGAESRMASATERFPSARGIQRELLNQAARELLLLQSSDWPFLITTGQANRYAVRRFLQHVERFNRLIRELQVERPDRGQLDEIWQKDNIFPEIDYRWFKP